MKPNFLIFLFFAIFLEKSASNLKNNVFLQIEDLQLPTSNKSIII